MLVRLVRHVRNRTHQERPWLRLIYLLHASESPLSRRWIGRLIRPWLTGPDADVWRTSRIAFERRAAELARPELVKSLLLKAPGADGEKGVLYVSFEENGLRLIEHYDAARLLRDYVLVVASSTSPPDYPSFLSLANLTTDPVIVQISNPRDFGGYSVCAPVVQPVRIMACDWINPAFYRPKPHDQRQIDVLMVAGWAALKGHRFLFQAIRHMSPRLRVVLIGQDMEGRTADDVWAQAKDFGVSRRIELVRNASPGVVSDYQCDSRTSVVLSRREGSSVVTTESFFADAPVAMFRSAHVGARRYVNDRTGILTTDTRLARDLSNLIDRSESFDPRAWALAHVTCWQSTKRLNAVLQDNAHEHHRPWTRDIVPMCWRPDPVYVNEHDLHELAPAYEDLRDRLGINFRDYPTDLVGR